MRLWLFTAMKPKRSSRKRSSAGRPKRYWIFRHPWSGSGKALILAPLIGTLDSLRTQVFMERFLEAIVETKASVALLDITGVPTVDTQTAQHVIEAITAAKLLGAKVVLTGVRPAIAQTLVHLGIDLTGIETQSSLSAGLSLALDLLNLRVISNND